MPLTSGAKLGLYEILAPVGAGGMGEVYKARDTKLEREVAIKVLPEAFAEDKERLARFEREARLLASLNHPNIATLFDLQESDGVHFLVLEFVPGETLAERIAKGPIPIEEALPIFKQIAEAIEAAHEQGIIHRDLKPANVKVTPDGRIKVLDFGLAKAFGDKPAASDSSQSPTLTRDATRAGVILGTASYMSPEQARGKAVDKRTDIWAFGCCLYEAVTGKKAFSGETVTDTLATIIKNDPDWKRLSLTVPPTIQALLQRCLRKDANRRLQHMGDARVDIEDAMSGPSPASPPTPSPGSTWQAVLIASVVAALAAGIGVWSLTRPSPSPPRPIKRLTLLTQPTISLATGRETVGPHLAISHDGSKVVYVGRQSGTRQLFVRTMDQFETAPLRGTEGASQPFFSPDDQWIGFLAEGKLKKVSLAGGPPVTLCVIGDVFHGASWARDEIIFAPETAGLFKIPAAGGEPQEVTQRESNETSHMWPNILPGGKAILFTSWIGSQDNYRIAVQSLGTSVKRILIEEGRGAHYASSGHIVFARGDSILAVPFDPERLEVTGSPVPLLEGIFIGPRSAPEFGLSDDGTLAYISADSTPSNLQLVWVSRDGAEQPLTAAMRDYNNPRLSPDGRRLALAMGFATAHIWILDLTRETITRFSFGEGVETRPVWFPDGERILFASNRNGRTFNVFSKPTDGGEAEQLTTGAYRVPTSVSSDGKNVIFRQVNEDTTRDIGLLRLDGNREPTMLLQTPFDEHTGRLSPDDRWLAYVSNESGREEIYMQPFPDPGRKWQISTEGGSEPVWARNGKELFYRNGEKMMAVTIHTGPDFAPGKPSLLFEGEYLYGGPEPFSNYDVSRDGQRFVMIKTEETSTPTHIRIVHNWFEELKRLVPREE